MHKQTSQRYRWRQGNWSLKGLMSVGSYNRNRKSVSTQALSLLIIIVATTYCAQTKPFLKLISSLLVSLPTRTAIEGLISEGRGI